MNDTDSKFESLFKTHYVRLKHYVSRFVNGPSDIEDIVQETFVKSYEASEKIDIKNMRAYFYTAARNLSFKHNAKHSNKLTDYMEDMERLEDLGLSEVLSTMRPVEDEAQAHEQFAIFCEAVRELPLKCRRVFILKRVYGQSNIDIADRLGISVHTVSKHLVKGMSRCAQYMAENGYFDNNEKGGRNEQHR